MTDETLVALGKNIFKKPECRVPELRKFYERLIQHLKEHSL